MKIGLISDVHADLKLLRRALGLLHEQAVDLVVCAGDLIDRGLEGNAVVQVFQDQAIPCVQGNHDAAVLHKQDRPRRKSDLSLPEMQAQILNQKSIDFLLQLPPTQRFTWENHDVLLAHGTPSDCNEYVFSSTPNDRFRAIAREAESDILILGHTHEPMCARVNGVWVLNPGSIWYNRFGVKHTCAILQLPAYEFDVFDVLTGYPIALSKIEI